jgi:hypothetical protein
MLSPVLIVRWFGWSDGPLVPIYPGAEAPAEVPLVGVTVLDEAVAYARGELLTAWATAARVHAH